MGFYTPGLLELSLENQNHILDLMHEAGVRWVRVFMRWDDIQLSEGLWNWEKYDKLIEEGLLPIKRWGKPDDIAQAVLAMALGYLSYSTGEVINVDGGFHLPRL